MNGRARKGEEGEEGMEPGSSVSRFRHCMGAVSGWQCSDGGKAWNPGAVFLGSDTTWEQCRGGSVVMKREAVGGYCRLLLIVICVGNGYREVERLAREPTAVS